MVATIAILVKLLRLLGRYDSHFAVMSTDLDETLQELNHHEVILDESLLSDAVTIFNTSLPVCNSFTFYRMCLKSNPTYQWASLIYRSVIGAVVTVRKGKDILIMSLAVKASYRNYGVGHSLLKKLKESCLKDKLEEIHLHVQETNEDAIRFYKREGFVERERISNFYKRLEHKTAIHMVYRV